MRPENASERGPRVWTASISREGDRRQPALSWKLRPSVVPLRRECGTERGQVAGVSHIGRQEELNAWMLREIHPTSADEQTSVRKRDRLDEPTGKDVRHIAAAIEEDLGVERERGAHERPPVRGECVLLD